MKKNRLNFILLLPFFLTLSGCSLDTDNPTRSLVLTILWIFLVLGIITGLSAIFGDDGSDKQGSASIICLIIFLAMLITA